MRDELLNETPFFDLDAARPKIAMWVADYNGSPRQPTLPHSAPGDRMRNPDQLR
jgi:putative transposase